MRLRASGSTNWWLATRTDAYVDTSAFIAFMDVTDTYHALFRRLFADPPGVVVTASLVIAEGHGWFLRRFDRVRALQFLAMIDDMPFLAVRHVGSAPRADGRAAGDPRVVMARFAARPGDGRMRWGSA